jgi:hypothetical protein
MAPCQELVRGSHGRPRPIVLERQVEPDQPECRGDGRRRRAGVLGAIGIDGQLVVAAQASQMLRLIPENLGVQVPACR